VMYFKYIRSELNVCVCMCVCMCVYVLARVCVCVCVSVSVSVCVCLCVCLCVHVAKYRCHTICIPKLNINVLSIRPSIRASA
jgi:hypothetical protein